MKLLKSISRILLLICLIVVGLNFLGSKKQQPSNNNSKEYTTKDTINVIVSVNWTGSITGIGGSYDSSTHYLKQLKSYVKDKLQDLFESLSKDKVLNVSYCYFGLVQSEDVEGPNPDFARNYIKIFKKNCKNFNYQDWNSLIDNMRQNKKGYHTALSVARELSVIFTARFIERQFDENYLILVSDNFFNVVGTGGISEEMDHLQKWSRDPKRKHHEKIKNINFAGNKAKAFHQHYSFFNKMNIPILPGNLGGDDPHFEIRLFQIRPIMMQEVSNFLNYPDRIKYEYLSNELIKIPLKIAFRNEVLENSRYTPNKIVLSIVTKKNDCLFQETFTSTEIPDKLIIPKTPQPFFDLKIFSYYDYDDEGIFSPYRERHMVDIPCEKTGLGKLIFIFPVKGILLKIHNFVGVFKGQVSAANCWNFVILLTTLLWVIQYLLPYIMPPIPEVKFTLEK